VLYEWCTLFMHIVAPWLGSPTVPAWTGVRIESLSELVSCAGKLDAYAALALCNIGIKQHITMWLPSLVWIAKASSLAWLLNL
jgi:hypothetical protein